VTPDLQAEYRRRCVEPSDIRDYLPLLHECARTRPRARVLELGVRTGHSTIALLSGAVLASGHVWSVDVADVRGLDGGMGPWRDHPAWTFTAGDATSPVVAAAQPAQIDVLFIDAGHGYDETLAELEAYMPRLAPGGVALCHDTRLHMAGEGPYPVARALDTYCAGHGLGWRDLPGEYGMGVVTP